MQHLHFLC